MNVPNKVTMGRLALSLVLFGFLWRLGLEPTPAWELYLTAALVFILAVSTDWLDGYLARRLGQVSDFGRIVDPVADKFVICGSLIFLTAADWARPLIPPWAVVIVVGREFLVTGIRGFLEARRTAFGASWLGKLKMLSQCFAVPAILTARITELALPSLHEAARIVALLIVAIAVLMTVLSGVTYIVRAARLLRHE